MAYHGAPLGYAPASHLPFDQQNLPDARGPAVQRISTGFNSTGFAYQDFQGSSDASSHDQGSQMEVDGNEPETPQ